MIRRLLPVALLLLAAPGTTQGQQDIPVEPGQRIRLTLDDQDPRMGTFVSLDSRRLTFLGEDGESLAVPRSEILEMARYDEGAGFLETFGWTVVGASLGMGILFAVAWEPCRSTELFGCLLTPESRGDAFVWGLVGGGIVGVPIGLIAGLTTLGGDWTTVALEDTDGAPRLSVGLSGDGGLALRGSIAVGGRAR